MSRARLLNFLHEIAASSATTTQATGDRVITMGELERSLSVDARVVRRWAEHLIRDGLPVSIGGGALTFNASDLPRPLSQTEVGAALSPMAVTIEAQIASTNAWVLDRLQLGDTPDMTHGWLAATDVQSAGRGTRGRQWSAPAWRNITMTVARSARTTPVSLSGLSLAVGVCVADVLNRHCGIDAKIKWPNDVIVQDKKLAGLLVETVNVHGGHLGIVVGVGLNVDLARARTAQTDHYPIVDLKSLCDVPDRQGLLIVLAKALNELLLLFVQRSFADWQAAYQQVDALAGREVSIQFDRADVTGRVLGVNEQGHLRLMTEGGERTIASGTLTRWRRD